MSKIAVARYSDLLRRFLAMKGVTDVSAELSPEISPVLVVEASLPEWAFLKNEKLNSQVFAIGPIGGLASAARLRNPAGSGVVAVIEEVQAEGDGGQILLVERNTDQGNLATILPTVNRDTRYEALATSALIASVDNVGASGEAFLSWRIISGVAVTGRPNFVLVPGFQVQCTNITLASSLRGFWQYRERAIGELELQ